MLCSGLGLKSGSDVRRVRHRRLRWCGGARLRDAIEAWQQGRLTEATDENACKEHRDQ
jgi:hypothetical protein